MTVSVRYARKADAKRIVELIREFTSYLQRLGDKPVCKLTQDFFIRDGFGRDRAFVPFVAVHQGKVIGYLTGYLGYEPENAVRIFYIVDLYVTASHRRSGAGQALMQMAAQHALRHLAWGLVWTAYKPNRLALDFYQKVGIKKTRSPLVSMFLDVNRLIRLARSK